MTAPVSTIILTVDLRDTEFVDDIAARRLYRASPYAIALTVKEGGALVGAGNTTALKLYDSTGEVLHINGTETDANGQATITINSGGIGFDGSYTAVIVVNGSKAADFPLKIQAIGSPLPPPGTVLNWNVFTGYDNTAADGPYRAGDNVTFTPNGDGSQDINVPDAPDVPVQSVDGRTGDVTLDDLYLGITAQAADVNPTGTAIAGALAEKRDNLEYLGFWNAATNSPALTDETGSIGEFYRVRKGGVQDLGSGEKTFVFRNYVMHDGASWEPVVSIDLNNMAWDQPFYTKTADEVPSSTTPSEMGGGPFSILSITNGTANGYPATNGILISIRRAAGLHLNFFGETGSDRIWWRSEGAANTFGTWRLLVQSSGLLTGNRAPWINATGQIEARTAADFRTLIGLVIGTDVQAQDAALQSYADAADAAARRALIDAAKASVLPDYIGGTHALPIASGVVTPDAEDGHSQKLTLTEDVTDFQLPDNLADGHSINIVGLQDGTGERAFNPAGAYRIMGASPADVSALGAGKAFQLGITRNGALYNMMIAVENEA